MDQRDLAVEAVGLEKRFGEIVALSGVDLTMPAGTVLGLLGPNGAGKTTLVRILATLLRPDGGRVRVAGHDLASHPDQVRRAIGVSGQFAAVDGYLTGGENLRMIGRLSGLGRRAARARAEELLEQFDLTSVGDRVAGGYSGGMRRRLDLAASLVARPPVLFLDEPTTGLDLRARRALWAAIADLTRGGSSVLLTTQYLEEADELADSVVLIDEGRVVTSGTPADLKAQVGGEHLELQMPADTDLAAVAAAVAGLGSRRPTVDAEARTVSLPVSDPAALIHAATRLAAHDLTVTGASLRRPSLDDVFLALTRQPTPTRVTPDARSIGDTA